MEKSRKATSLGEAGHSCSHKMSFNLFFCIRCSMNAIAWQFYSIFKAIKCSSHFLFPVARSQNQLQRSLWDSLLVCLFLRFFFNLTKRNHVVPRLWRHTKGESQMNLKIFKAATKLLCIISERCVASDGRSPPEKMSLQMPPEDSFPGKKAAVMNENWN